MVGRKEHKGKILNFPKGLQTKHGKMGNVLQQLLNGILTENRSIVAEAELERAAASTSAAWKAALVHATGSDWFSPKCEMLTPHVCSQFFNN